jgi:PIN domain nuclease of toxin-antitoxin system
MNYLLDTHTFLWFINADPSLSTTAQAAIETGTNDIFLSIASLWEMAIKVSLGKLIVPLPFAEFMQEQMHKNGIMLLQIQMAHIELVTRLPFHHRDPFDRLIITQSLVNQIPIIGKDDIFDAYGIQRLW